MEVRKYLFQSNYSAKYKIIFLGDAGVGKSSILNRFCNSKFDDSYQATIGLDFHSKSVVIGKKTIKLNFYDTAGQEKFKSLIPTYIKDADIIIIVFDVTNKSSFDHVRTWIKEIAEIRKSNSMISIIGNKLDLVSNIEYISEIQNLVSETNFIVCTMSAKTNDGVDEFFGQLYNEMINHFNIENDEPNQDLNVTEKFDINKLKQTTVKPNRKCCK